MYRVTRDIHFCYGHRLMGYIGKCAHPHGHNGKAQIELVSETLNSQGMVHDFGEIKTVIQSWIDANLDHRMLLRRDDPMVKYLREADEPFYVMDENPTAEAIAKLIFDEAVRRGFPVREVRLWETPQSCAMYRK